MSTVAVSLLTLVAGALISGAGTYVVARRTLAFDYDSDLRTRRIVAYTNLWSRLEPLAKYAPTEFFSQTEAQAFAESLRVWYFEHGGLFLSAATRSDYFALQDVLARITGGWGWATDEREKLTPAAREHLRTCGSRLRTGLTQDVGTRTRPKVRGAVEHLDGSFAGVYERLGGRRLELQVRPRMRRAPHLALFALEPDGTKRSCLERWSPARWTIHASIDDPMGERRERALLVERGRLVEAPALEEDRAPAALWKLLDLAPVISTNQLKNGNHIEVDGTIFKVVDFQHVKPGKGGAFVRTKLRRASDGNVIDKTFRAGEKFRAVRTEARKMTFLYTDGTDAHFMDAESYEQMSVPEAGFAEGLQWTKPNDPVDVLFIDGQPADLQLPASVVLEVAQTDPGLRGDTASGGGTKPATLETGATVNVPLFVDIGDSVKVDTRSGEYMSRA